MIGTIERARHANKREIENAWEQKQARFKLHKLYLVPRRVEEKDFANSCC